MKKINFVNGTTIDGASTFNQMQDNVEEVFNGEEPMGSIVVEGIECTNRLEVPNPFKLTGNQEIYFTEPLPAGTYTIGFASKTTNGANNCRFIISKTVGGTEQDITLYGENKKTFTITEECNKVDIYSQDTWANSQNKTTTFNELVLVKGTELLPYSPYKKIGHNSTESMGKIVVDDISCKNMIDISQFKNGYLDSIGGFVSNPSLLLYDEKYCDYIKVNPNTTYTFTIFETSTNYEDWIGIQQFDTNKSFITRIVKENSRTFEFTTSSTTHYVMLSARNLVGATKVQFELGKVTSYTPYKEFDNSKIVHKHIYSLQEHIVGTWHNGKPIYEKTIVFGAGIGTADINGRAFPLTDFGISNVEEIFLRQPTHFTGFHDNTDVNVPFPYYNGVYNYYVEACYLWIRIICTDQVAVNKRMVFTLNYTKTTDVAPTSTQSAPMMSLRPDTTEVEETE